MPPPGDEERIDEEIPEDEEAWEQELAHRREGLQRAGDETVEEFGSNLDARREAFEKRLEGIDEEHRDDPDGYERELEKAKEEYLEGVHGELGALEHSLDEEERFSKEREEQVRRAAQHELEEMDEGRGRGFTRAQVTRASERQGRIREQEHEEFERVRARAREMADEEPAYADEVIEEYRGRPRTPPTPEEDLGEPHVEGGDGERDAEAGKEVGTGFPQEELDVEGDGREDGGGATTPFRSA